MVGYAVTGRFGAAAIRRLLEHLRDRADFWNAFLQVPVPRILVLEEQGQSSRPRSICRRYACGDFEGLGLFGLLNERSSEELPSGSRDGIQLFAGSVAVSHAYAHIFDVGDAVRVGGMEIRPGDLLHGDRHGVLPYP